MCVCDPQNIFFKNAPPYSELLIYCPLPEVGAYFYQFRWGTTLFFTEFQGDIYFIAPKMCFYLNHKDNIAMFISKYEFPQFLK